MRSKRGAVGSAGGGWHDASVRGRVDALMTCLLLFVVLLATVQPSSRLSCGPSVAPLGPQAVSGTTPLFVAGSKAPSTMIPEVKLAGSITIIPPSQVTLAAGPVRHPFGFSPRIGTDT